ncbi:hypothetical protein EX30DRAFT_368891 [Ascodesmis nigricans]|uniref:Uncharacterized protein n=1 Tax=Ascodesmis nigricans TaxID=341454 RepID=A0A4S2N3C5_9PEZI|nr:hypothetical protein EX30DRAFT_368891 [Ascodesmis nigricans]
MRRFGRLLGVNAEKIRKVAHVFRDSPPICYPTDIKLYGDSVGKFRTSKAEFATVGESSEHSRPSSHAIIYTPAVETMNRDWDSLSDIIIDIEEERVSNEQPRGYSSLLSDDKSSKLSEFCKLFGLKSRQKQARNQRPGLSTSTGTQRFPHPYSRVSGSFQATQNTQLSYLNNQADDVHHFNGSASLTTPHPGSYPAPENLIDLSETGQPGHSHQRPGPKKNAWMALDTDRRQAVNRYKQALEKEVEKNKTLENQLLDDHGTIELERQRHAEELAACEAQAQRFQDLYVRSSHCSGSGLEPISDQTFADKLRQLDDDLGQLCRQIFRGIGPVFGLDEENSIDLVEPDGMPLANSRVLNLIRLKDMSAARFLEMTVWEKLEHGFGDQHFLGIDREVFSIGPEVLGIVEHLVSCGDSTENKGRTEFYRSFIHSMIFQNPDVQRGISQQANAMTEHLKALMRTMGGRRHPQVVDKLESLEICEKLRDVVHRFAILITEMRCQKPTYGFDHSITPGDMYDPLAMKDITNTVDPGEDMVVSAIISRGIVRKASRVSFDVLTYLRSTKVVLVPRNDGVSL